MSFSLKPIDEDIAGNIQRLEARLGKKADVTELPKDHFSLLEVEAIARHAVSEVRKDFDSEINELQKRLKALESVKPLKAEITEQDLRQLRNELNRNIESGLAQLEKEYTLSAIGFSQQVDGLKSAWSTFLVKFDTDAVAQNAAVTGSQLDVNYETTVSGKIE